jgi:AcrR family transcriptional regulator
VKHESSANTKAKLLDACERLILRDGVASLTINAVAREAGLSKGGMLYHFRSKDALIAAMVERFMARLDAEIVEHLKGDHDAPGEWVRAYARACVSAPGPQLDAELAVSSSLLAAMATDTALMGPLRQRYREWQERAVQDGIDPVIATIVRLAADGLWLSELFDLAPPSGALREQVLDTLLRLARA